MESLSPISSGNVAPANKPVEQPVVSDKFKQVDKTLNSLFKDAKNDVQILNNKLIIKEREISVKKESFTGKIAQIFKKGSNEGLEQEKTKLAEDKKTAVSELKKLRNRLSGLNTAYDLFGGKEAFMNLPVLDLTKTEVNKPNYEYIDFIKPEDMKDSNGKEVSIMRGVDRYDRPFFAIKGKDEDGIERVQTFHPRNVYDEATWTDASTRGPGQLVPLNPRWIVEGKPKKDDLAKIKALIDRTPH